MKENPVVTVKRVGTFADAVIQRAMSDLAVIADATQSDRLRATANALYSLKVGAFSEITESCGTANERFSSMELVHEGVEIAKYPVLCASCIAHEVALQCNPSKILGFIVESQTERVVWLAIAYTTGFIMEKLNRPNTMEAAETLLDEIHSEEDCEALIKLSQMQATTEETYH